LFVDGGSNSVAIGTSIPDVSTYFGKVLHIKGASAGVMFERTDNEKYSIGVVTGGTLDFASAGNTRMRMTSGGDLSIGTTDINARLNVTSNGVATTPMRINNTATGSSNNNSLIFQRAGTNVGLIGTTNNSTSYGTSSDYRLKENVDYTFDATTRLKQLKPARFNFISDADITVDGFIAHEVSSVVPEAIIGTKDATETYTDENGDEQTRPNYQAIDQAKLVPLLVKTIQELEARITQLENA
jgi:uncharacterized protein YaiE (UPF0345 family)